MRRRRVVALLLAMLWSPAVAGCSLLGGPPTYAGTVAFGFEVEEFRPCGRDESWWVTSAPQDLRERYRAAAGFDYKPVYVVVEGIVGPPGEYGHLGAYDHELEVTRLLEMDPRRGSC
jgi:putative lipoprotein